MEIVLEKKTGDTVQAMDAGHVFQTGDILRFRLRPAFDGFLYVTDLGTSGRTSLLFPKQETGSDNRIDHTREYVVPATPDGWFEVSGPPGYETLYFVMSPWLWLEARSRVRLRRIRTRESRRELRRRRCIRAATMKSSSRAGIAWIRMLARSGSIRRRPCLDQCGTCSEIVLQGKCARDLNFTQKSSSSVVTSVSPMNGPVVYEFLLAHN